MDGIGEMHVTRPGAWWLTSWRPVGLDETRPLTVLREERHALVWPSAPSSIPRVLLCSVVRDDAGWYGLAFRAEAWLSPWKSGHYETADGARAAVAAFLLELTGASALREPAEGMEAEA